MAAFMILVLIMLDQWTKGLAERLIGTGGSVTVIPGFFELHCSYNKGAAWSILADKTWGLTLLTILSSLVLFALLFYLRKVEDRKSRIVLILLAAGSAGNLIDRLRVGAVTDFLSFTFGTYVFPTFNFADAMVTVGAGLLLLFTLVDKRFLTTALKENGLNDKPDSIDPKEES